MCELLVGLPAVTVLAVDDPGGDSPLRVHVQTVLVQRPACPACGVAARVRDRDRVTLVDLPAFGRPARLVWHKRRWGCPDPACTTASWTEQAPTIAASRLVLTDRAGRWMTFQVGRHGRSVSEVAADLGCDWHTVNDAVIGYGTALVDDPDRIGDVTALGLDETLFGKRGRFRTKVWSTSIVDVRAGRLLVSSKAAPSAPASAWLAERGTGWCETITHATLDMSGPYRKVFDTMLSDPTRSRSLIRSNW